MMITFTNYDYIMITIIDIPNIIFLPFTIISISNTNNSNKYYYL